MSNDKGSPKNVAKTKTSETQILKAVVHEVEKGSIIVNVQGWRMRVYGENLDVGVGREVEISYTGDLKDIHTVKLIGLK